MRLLMEVGLDRRTARKLVAQEPLVALPLQALEMAHYRDYRTGTLFQASPAKAKAISEARQQYIQELHNFQKDLRTQKEAGERVEGEIIQTIARMNLTAWAKSARVSELLSRY